MRFVGCQARLDYAVMTENVGLVDCFKNDEEVWNQNALLKFSGKFS